MESKKDEKQTGKLKKDEARGIQGEFGIGLPSFWTVGEELILASTGQDGLARRVRFRHPSDSGERSFTSGLEFTAPSQTGLAILELCTGHSLALPRS